MGVIRFLSIILLGIWIFLFPAQSYAQLRIAFFEGRDSSGNRIEMELGGRFFHVAIEYRGAWLHAHPARGVELTRDFSDLGKIVEILENVQFPPLQEKEIRHYLGMKYDSTYRWGESGVYCSELIALILGVSPKPMKFDSPRWRGNPNVKKGKLGISPDDLYKYFLEKQFVPMNLCQFEFLF